MRQSKPTHVEIIERRLEEVDLHLLFNSLLAAVHRERVAHSIPWWGHNPGGSL